MYTEHRYGVCRFGYSAGKPDPQYTHCEPYPFLTLLSIHSLILTTSQPLGVCSPSLVYYFANFPQVHKSTPETFLKLTELSCYTHPNGQQLLLASMRTPSPSTPPYASVSPLPQEPMVKSSRLAQTSSIIMALAHYQDRLMMTSSPAYYTNTSTNITLVVTNGPGTSQIRVLTNKEAKFGMEVTSLKTAHLRNLTRTATFLTSISLVTPPALQMIFIYIQL